MSYTEMFKVSKGGLVEWIAEFKNAFRGAFLVWNNMAKEYLGQSAGLLMSRDAMGPVWDLAKRKDIPLAHRIVLMATFDKVMVRQENIAGGLIVAVETYAETFDPGTLLIQVKKLRELCNDRDCQAVCWNQTSVCAEAWWVDDDEKEEGRPYDITRDTGHWFLFDREQVWRGCYGILS